MAKKVLIHVTFIKIGEIDTLKENFEADVLLCVKWREPELDGKQSTSPTSEDLATFWNPGIFVENAIGDPKQKVTLSAEWDDEGQAYVMERRRVAGKFVEQLELGQFPFDVQDLSVRLMPESRDPLELVEDPTQVHKISKQSFIDEQEWYLYRYIDAVPSHTLLDVSDPLSRKVTLTVRCRACRRPGYFFWNIISVTVLLCCLAFVTFAVNPVKVENRLQLTFTLVLTAVAFKFVVNQSLPKVSYLTYLDRYVLSAMILLTIVCCWHGILSVIAEDHKHRADKVVLGIVCAIYLAYNIYFWVKIYRKPYSKRREMKRKEAAYTEAVANEAKTKPVDRGPADVRVNVEDDALLKEDSVSRPKEL